MLMPGPAWSRGQLGVPRTALAPISALVFAALGPLADEVNATIRGTLADNAAVVRRAGTRLWPAAADVMDHAGPPANWTEATGLGPAEFRTIAGCFAAVLSEAVWIDTATRIRGEGWGPDADELRAWLDDATARHPEPPGVLLAVLVAQLPEAVELLGRASNGAEPAIDFLLDRLETAPEPDPDLAEAAATVQRAATLLTRWKNPALASGRPACRAPSNCAATSARIAGHASPTASSSKC